MRPEWDDYFLKIAEVIGSRSTCDKGYFTGCVIVDQDNCILATGYAGSPSGTPHCDDKHGHHIVQVNDGGNVTLHCIRTTHAEANAIASAARKGVALKGATLYCILEPCWECAKLIERAGIIRVVAKKYYHRAVMTRELFAAKKIELVIKENYYG